MDLVGLGKNLIGQIPELINDYDEELDSIGQLVFAVRIERKLTQSELARLADVEEHIIHKIEGGNIRVDESKYKSVFKALDINPPQKGEVEC